MIYAECYATRRRSTFAYDHRHDNDTTFAISVTNYSLVEIGVGINYEDVAFMSKGLRRLLEQS